MKKILFLILFLTGLFPVFNDNGLHLGIYQSYGQEDTYGEDENGDMIICSGNVSSTFLEETDTSILYEECYLEYSEEIKGCEEICGIKIEQKPEDCAGVNGGTAYYDSCGCIGGTTGIPDCGSTDCAGVAGGSAYYDYCGCIGGTTGIDSCDPEPTTDCAGVEGGTAYMASCGCIGGTTGITECPPEKDCAGVVGGSAYMASCGCIGGTTGKTECPPEKDCNGVEGGTAYTASCGCIGGTTGISVCPDCLTSTADLDKVFPNAPDSKLLQLKSILNKYMGEFGINTKEKLQHFLSQAGHESGGFSNLGVTENLNYSASRLLAVWPKRFSQTDSNLNDPDDFDYNPAALGNLVYGNRLGNTSSGDGYKYRGRGIFQLTGKTNYQEFQNFYNTKFDPNINIISNPDLLTTDTNLAVISALWFYQKKVLNKIEVNVNTDISVITKKINGGLNGLNDRVIKYNSAKTNIKCN